MRIGEEMENNDGSAKPTVENKIESVETRVENFLKKNNPADSEKIKAELAQASISEREKALEKIRALEKLSGLDVSQTIKDMENNIGEMKDEVNPQEEIEKLSEKPEDKNLEIKNEVEEKIINEEKPLDEERIEILKKEAVGGLEQEDKDIKEGENSIVQDVEKNEDKNRAEILEKSTQFLKEKIKNSEFFDSVSSLANTLRGREENNFFPLVDPEAIPYLVSASNDMTEAIQSQRSNIEEINSCAKRICGVINAIGRELPKTSGARREDTDVLSRVAFNLQNLAESSKRMTMELGAREDENLEESVRYFKKLTELSEERWSFVVRKRQMWDDVYSR